MIVEEIGIVDALADEDSVCYVADLGVSTSFVVEADCVTDLFAEGGASLFADSVGHADGCHTSRLRANDLDLCRGLDCALCILLYTI